VDLSTFIVAVFCLIDDRLKGRRIRQRGPAPKLSDAEVLTIEVVGEFLGLDEDTELFAYFRRHYAHFFPNLGRVHRATFARQAANLWKTKEHLWQELLPEIPHDPRFALADSFPLPACLFARAHRCRRFRGEAGFGKDTLLKQTFYGFRVHVRVAWPGLITHLLLRGPRQRPRALGAARDRRRHTRPDRRGPQLPLAKNERRAGEDGHRAFGPLLLQEARSASRKKRPLEPFSLPHRH